MKLKCLYSFFIVSILFGNIFAEESTGSSQKDPELQIYLPREITIPDDTLKLGEVGIIRGPEDLQTKVNDISLGRFSVPGQEIVIARNTILSRLASNGITASEVILKGAEKITVKQKQQVISGNDFVSLARKFLEKNLTDEKVLEHNPISTPKNIYFSNECENIEYSYNMKRNSRGNQASVEITVLADGKKIGTRNVTFSMQYECRTPVAIIDIPAGTLISTENIKIEKRPSSYPEPADWKAPYGLIAKNKIPANTAINTNMIGSITSHTVLKRNQNVVIRIKKPGFEITALGMTMQDGKTGDFIKVRNVDSQRIIMARINEDGSVEPVL